MGAHYRCPLEREEQAGGDRRVTYILALLLPYSVLEKMQEHQDICEVVGRRRLQDVAGQQVWSGVHPGSESGPGSAL